MSLPRAQKGRELRSGTAGVARRLTLSLGAYVRSIRDQEFLRVVTHARSCNFSAPALLIASTCCRSQLGTLHILTTSKSGNKILEDGM